MREEDGRIYYEVGDKVRVIDEAPRWCNVGFSLGMRACLSQVLTIKSVNAHGSYTIDEGDFEKPILIDFLKLYIKRLR